MPAVGPQNPNGAFHRQTRKATLILPALMCSPYKSQTSDKLTRINTCRKPIQPQTFVLMGQVHPAKHNYIYCNYQILQPP